MKYYLVLKTQSPQTHWVWATANNICYYIESETKLEAELKLQAWTNFFTYKDSKLHGKVYVSFDNSVIIIGYGPNYINLSSKDFILVKWENRFIGAGEKLHEIF